MDIVCNIIDKIKNDDDFKKCKKFTSSFLNNAGEVLLKHGFCSARLFVEGKKDDKDKWQANALISVLQILQNYKEIEKNRGLGKLIIKTLPTLKEQEGKHASTKNF